MPAGSRIYVSGQADRSMHVYDATKKTLESLSATLKHCGRTDADVAQVRCFVPSSITDIHEVTSEVRRYYGNEDLPISVVEWKSAAPLLEIELVAWGGPANDDAKEALEFITPPD